MSKIVRRINLGLACSCLLALSVWVLGFVSSQQIITFAQSALAELQDIPKKLYALEPLQNSPEFTSHGSVQKDPAPSMWNCGGTFTNEVSSVSCEEIPVTKVKDKKGNKYITKQW